MIGAVDWFHKVDLFWPNCPLLDPRGQCGDLIFRQALALLWHAHLFIVATHETDQVALISFPRDNRRLVEFTSVKGTGTHIEPQTGFLLVCAMAVIAVFLEYWSDVADEIYRFCTEFSSGRK